MTIKTKYDVGDVVVVEGVERKIISVHIYESDNKHTERYYFGNREWITIVRKGKEKMIIAGIILIGLIVLALWGEEAKEAGYVDFGYGEEGEGK